MAYAHDVAIATKTNWQLNSIAALRNIGNMFALTLSMNLTVDGSSRMGEFLPNSRHALETGFYLKWKDLEFWPTKTVI